MSVRRYRSPDAAQAAEACAHHVIDILFLVEEGEQGLTSYAGFDDLSYSETECRQSL